MTKTITMQFALDADIKFIREVIAMSGGVRGISCKEGTTDVRIRYHDERTTEEEIVSSVKKLGIDFKIIL